nr:MAG TPA: hypothetical protein [Caudoviricetes sp.]
MLTEVFFSKLPIRQITFSRDFRGILSISKLPIRQITYQHPMRRWR